MTAPDPAEPRHPVPEGIAEKLGAAARSLQGETDLHDTMTEIVRVAVQTIPGAEDAGVALVEHGKINTVAQTSDLIWQADEAQYRVGQGPCVDAVWEHRVFRIDDLDHDARWPRFAAAMTGLGVRSMVSFRLFVAGDTLGVLNMFSSQPGAFDAEAESVGELFATHAAVALAGSRTEAQLENAMTTRDVIGTARGILAERHQVTAEQAFRMLVKISQTSNVRLADVARAVVAAADQAAITTR